MVKRRKTVTERRKKRASHFSVSFENVPGSSFLATDYASISTLKPWFQSQLSAPGSRPLSTLHTDLPPALPPAIQHPSKSRDPLASPEDAAHFDAAHINCFLPSLLAIHRTYTRSHKRPTPVSDIEKIHRPQRQASPTKAWYVPHFVREYYTTFESDIDRKRHYIPGQTGPHSRPVLNGASR